MWTVIAAPAKNEGNMKIGAHGASSSAIAMYALSTRQRLRKAPGTLQICLHSGRPSQKTHQHIVQLYTSPCSHSSAASELMTTERRCGTHETTFHGSSSSKAKTQSNSSTTSAGKTCTFATLAAPSCAVILRPSLRDMLLATWMSFPRKLESAPGATRHHAPRMAPMSARILSTLPGLGEIAPNTACM